MSVTEILLFGGFCIAGSITQSVSGFGFAIVLVAGLPLFGVPIQDVVVLIGIAVMPNLLIALWRTWRHVSLRRVAWVLVGMPIGVPVGIYLLTEGAAWLVHALLGMVLVWAAVEPFLLPSSGPRPTKPIWGIATGVATGALGAAFGTGGPPMVVYFCRRQWPKEVTKASLVSVFIVNVTMRTVGYVWTGLFTRDLLLTGLAFCPAVVLGTLVGERLFHAISQEAFRRIMAAMLALCGLYQIAKAVGAF